MVSGIGYLNAAALVLPELQQLCRYYYCLQMHVALFCYMICHTCYLHDQGSRFKVQCLFITLFVEIVVQILNSHYVPRLVPCSFGMSYHAISTHAES